MDAIHIVRTFHLDVPDGSELREVAKTVVDANGVVHMVAEMVPFPRFKRVTKRVDLLIAGPGLEVHHRLEAQVRLSDYPEGTRVADTVDATRYLTMEPPPGDPPTPPT